MYHTQMEAARKGIITKEMKIVAKKEFRTEEEIRDLVAKGQVAICANKRHTCLDPNGVGSALRTKINVNLGVSKDCKDYDVEMEKVMAAVNMGAEAIMDLSSHGDTQPFRRKLTSECPAMIGTVPVYDSVIHYQRDLSTLSAKDFIDVIRLHAQDGVDFVTLHCGITRKTIEQIKKHKRKMNIVSRGGSLVFAWMSMTGEENPFYEYYDEILEICREYDVTISLGDACRPGCPVFQFLHILCRQLGGRDECAYFLQGCDHAALDSLIDLHLYNGLIFHHLSKLGPLGALAAFFFRQFNVPLVQRLVGCLQLRRKILHGLHGFFCGHSGNYLCF